MPMFNEKGEKEMDVLSVSAALQIAGRAGRYGTVWDTVSIIQFISLNVTKDNADEIKICFSCRRAM